MNIDTAKRFENPEEVKKIIAAFDNSGKILDQKFDKLKEFTAIDCVVIDETELIKESNTSLQMYNKYSMLFADEKREFFKIKLKLEEFECYLFDYYRFSYDKSTKLSDSSVNKYVCAHPIYIKIHLTLDNYKNYLEYIERVLEYFKTKNFTIKNIIELRKIELGLCK